MKIRWLKTYLWMWLVTPVLAVSVLGRLMLDSWLSWVTIVLMLLAGCSDDGLIWGGMWLADPLITRLSLIVSFAGMSISTFPFSTVNTEVGIIFFFNLFIFFNLMLIKTNTASITTQVMAAVKPTMTVNIRRSSFSTLCRNITLCKYCEQSFWQSANEFWFSQISWQGTHLFSKVSQ